MEKPKTSVSPVPREKSLQKNLKETGEVFDIIHSKDLENLFQKNAHLLNRISTTQRRNSLLQKELFSLIEEKSKLDVKNSSLNSEVASLREKVSFFKTNQKLFNEQSKRLKAILTDIKLSRERKRETGQTHFKEMTALKENYESLRKVLSRQEEGFASALQSLRKKHFKVVKKKEAEQSKKIEDLTTALKSREKDLRESRKETDLFKQKLEMWRQNRERAGFELSHSQSQLKEEKQRTDREITKLKEEIQNLSHTRKVERLREQEVLKTEYEHRIQLLTETHEKKLKHICAEMENDLCSEKRKTETLKSLKDREIKYLLKNTETISEEARRLKVINHTLETSNKETSERLKREISENTALKHQNSQLKELWRDLQQKSEKQNQQVESLQELNRSLSIQLNDTTRLKESAPSSLKETDRLTQKKPEKSDRRHVLADIHFD